MSSEVAFLSSYLKYFIVIHYITLVWCQCIYKLCFCNTLNPKLKLNCPVSHVWLSRWKNETKHNLVKLNEHKYDDEEDFQEGANYYLKRAQ